MKSKVSICVPTYNRKDYLAETLASVYSQTYTDYEVVVVDDGSTDGTSDMIERAGYKNLRYHWQKNSGDAAARNKLINLAQGQYITFVDSDDLLMPDSVERLIRAEESQDDAVIAYGPYLRIDENGKVYGASKRKLYSGFITKYLFESIIVHSCGSMFPKQVLEQAGGFDQSLPVCSDYDLWLRLSLKCRFIALSGPTFKRRRHQGNLSVISSGNQITELKVLECFYFEKGGKSIIPKRIAMRRLSRQQYRAGKYLLKEKDTKKAIQYFRTSFLQHPNLKALWMQGLTILKYPYIK
ncbi:MAG: glycosyltransferase [Sedimentisphaerales bacterium]|nr:glycosyltransferase [Sedimentisphaerales bacterium]